MAACPKYGFEITDELRKSYCSWCDGCASGRPRRDWLGAVDTFDLARKLKARGARLQWNLAKGKRSRVPTVVTVDKVRFRLSKCPACGMVSLFHHRHTTFHECLNDDCKRTFEE